MRKNTSFLSSSPKAPSVSEALKSKWTNLGQRLIPAPVSITIGKPFNVYLNPIAENAIVVPSQGANQGAVIRKWNLENICLLPKVKIQEFTLNSIKDIEKEREIEIKWLFP